MISTEQGLCFLDGRGCDHWLALALTRTVPAAVMTRPSRRDPIGVDSSEYHPCTAEGGDCASGLELQLDDRDAGSDDDSDSDENSCYIGSGNDSNESDAFPDPNYYRDNYPLHVSGPAECIVRPAAVSALPDGGMVALVTSGRRNYVQVRGDD